MVLARAGDVQIHPVDILETGREKKKGQEGGSRKYIAKQKRGRGRKEGKKEERSGIERGDIQSGRG